jgi:hypothetical protein
MKTAARRKSTARLTNNRNVLRQPKSPAKRWFAGLFQT